MTTKKELVTQTQRAYEFMEKLFFEVSYLIKEVEGMLSEEGFTICKCGGYAITTRSSNALDTKGVNMWLLRKMSVAFVEEDKTELYQGITKTPLDDSLKVLYLRIILNDTIYPEPTVIAGVINKIKTEHTNLKRFEHVLTHLEYNENKVFNRATTLDYQDPKFEINGNLFEVNLYDIGDSATIKTKIVDPMLGLYRKI